MSTPPFVDLPAGVVPERWPVRGSRRAVLHAGIVPGRDVVLLIPGFTGSKEDFIAVLPLLAEAGLAAVAFDQLGQFESDAAEDPDAYALTLLAADVAEVAGIALSRCPDGRLHLVGHSFGGLVAQEVVAGAHLAPASLVLMCTGPGALPQGRWARLPDLVGALEQHDLATIWRLMQEMEQDEDPVRPAPQVMDFLERRWHANSPVQLQAFAQLLMTQPALTPRVRMRCAAEGIAVTVVWGERDDAWPIADQERMAAGLGAVAVELAGLGHSPNAEDPRATAAALLEAVGRSGR